MNYVLTELKEQHPWLCNYHSKMLQMVCKQVAAARKTAKERLSYRKHDDFNVFTYNQSGFRIGNDRLSLSKIGTIKIVLHRQPVNVKQVTVCRRKDGKWYAVAACDVLRKQYSRIVYSNPVGIDVGITKFAHDSDNHVVENPQFLKDAQACKESTLAGFKKISRQQQPQESQRYVSHAVRKDKQQEKRLFAQAFDILQQPL
jgi:putative transposase